MNKKKKNLINFGIENYKQESAFLIEKVTGYKKYQISINGEKLINDEQVQELNEYILRRQNGEPLQYILGEWEFYGLNFKVGKGVLIPRQDTETLVEVALENLKATKNPVIADLCSGSGCIAISIEKNTKKSEVFAIEISENAIPYLIENINENSSNVKLIKGDICDIDTLINLPQLDMIVSNPPYLTDDDMNSLQKEVAFEPKMALQANDNGLYFYKTITRIWKEKLKYQGILAFECGFNQHNDIKNILEENGFENVCFKEDLCGIIRVVYGRKK